MALVAITTEEREYVQAYWFNRSIGADGSISNNTGTASRSVREISTTYRGDKESVRNALLEAQSSYSAAIVLRKIDGPWWEGDAVITTYGEWNVVKDGEGA